MYKFLFKRIFDFIFAFILFIVFFPILLITAIVLGIANRNIHVFFIQVRPGKDGKLFNILKFKTMTDEKGADGKLLPDEVRLTAVGKIVRAISLDELPQLINVLKGDMSLIGPRPLLVQYLSLYTKEQSRRHEVRPGITGWAQCHGRNAVSWAEKFELDVWYVDHCSFLLDLKIVALTVWKVFSREGITKEGQATTDYFNGNN